MARAAALCLLLVAASLRGQPPERKVQVFFEGSEVFGHVLSQARLKIVPKLEDVADNRIPPEDLLIVCFGDLASAVPQIQQALGMSLEDFVRKRGGLLLASNLRYQETLFGVQFTGRRDFLPRNYRWIHKNRLCPMVREPAHEHPIFKGLFLNQVGVKVGIASNCPAQMPAALRPAGADRLVPLAYFHETSQEAVWGPQGHVQVIGNLRLPDPRRVLLFGGHGLFVNGMMVQEDLDNFELADNVVRWLQTRSDGQRRQHVLFLHDGKLIDKIGLPIRRAALPPIPTPGDFPLAILNSLLTRLQTTFAAPIWAVLVCGITLFVGLYAFKRFMGSRRNLESATLTVGASSLSLSPDLVRERLLQRLDRREFWEPAQALIGDWFRRHAHVDLPFPIPRGPLPAHELTGGFWQKRELAKRLAMVWAIATRAPDRRVTAREFTALEGHFQALTQALAQGVLRFKRA